MKKRKWFYRPGWSQQKNTSVANGGYRPKEFTSWSLRSAQGAGSNKHLLRKRQTLKRVKWTYGGIHPGGKKDKHSQCSGKKLRPISGDLRVRIPSRRRKILLRLEDRQRNRVGFISARPPVTIAEKTPNLSSGGFDVTNSTEKVHRKLPQDRGFIQNPGFFPVWFFNKPEKILESNQMAIADCIQRVTP